MLSEYLNHWSVNVGIKLFVKCIYLKAGLMTHLSAIDFLRIGKGNG